ncbi:MAG TPA: hypothetical protein VM639_24310 [Dongiaceae bacterium]|nr:hypothetical protein [Dongiaceae bacterium]
MPAPSKMPPISREEAEYLIARHIAEKGVTLCKAGVAIGAPVHQLQADPATMLKFPDGGSLPSTGGGARAQIKEIARRKQEFIEINTLSGFKPGTDVPPKPAPRPVMVTIHAAKPLAKPTAAALQAVAHVAAAADGGGMPAKRAYTQHEGPKRRFEKHFKPGKPNVLARDHAAIVNAHSFFPSTVKPAAGEFQLLKSGEHQRKIGSHVVKGDWAQMPIFTLTLEERTTCPRSCGHWRDCYGNNMHWSTRISADETFLPKLERELGALNMIHRDGFVVRLHILGDFFSADYARFWQRMLATLRALRIFGYTARTPSDAIGVVIDSMNRESRGNCLIRFSNGVAYVPRTVTIDKPEQAGAAIICPAQTEKTACCGTCALCWSSDKPIAFLRH